MSTILERLLVAAADGIPADFREDRKRGEDPAIKSGVLRRVFMGGKTGFEPADFEPAQCFRWDIRGLRIEGCLDLRDARLPSGGALAALEFYECTFENGVWADGAYAQRLHLSGCKIGPQPCEIGAETDADSDSRKHIAEISIQGLQVENDVKLTGLSPLTEDGLLCVDANACRIGTRFVLSRSTLRAPDNPEGEDGLKVPYALNLRNAVIGADLRVRPGVHIRGGLLARGAEVKGDFSITGAILHDGLSSAYRQNLRRGEKPLRSAIALRSARIGGVCWFWTDPHGVPVVITGEADLAAVEVGAGLILRGTKIDADVDQSKPLQEWPSALNLQGATIKGSLSVLSPKPLTAGLAAAPLGTELSEQTHDADAQQSLSMVFEQNAPEPETAVKGTLNLDGAIVGGQLWIEGNIASITARNASVANVVWLKLILPARTNVEKSASGHTPEARSTSAYGLIWFAGANLQRDVYCDVNYQHSGWLFPVRPCEGLLETAVGSHATGLNMNEAVIGGLLAISGTFEYVDAVSVRVEGDFIATEATVVYGVNMMKASLGGDCLLSGFAFLSRAEENRRLDRPSLSLRDADIRRTLELRGSPQSVTFLKARERTPACYPMLQVIEIKARHQVRVVNQESGAEAQTRAAPTERLEIRDDWVACIRGRAESAQLFNGDSAVFHNLNKKLSGPDSYLCLQDEEQILDYLRLFGAYVWGEDGSFSIVTSDGDRGQPYTEADLNSESDMLPQFAKLDMPDLQSGIRITLKPVVIDTHTRYGQALFKATYKIDSGGGISMTDYEPLCELKKDSCPTYLAPFKFGARADVSDYRQNDSDWREMSERELTELIPEWRSFFDPSALLRNAIVDLTDASCGTLQDVNGAAWGDQVLLRLENFTYARTTEDRDTQPAGLHWRQLQSRLGSLPHGLRKTVFPESKPWTNNLLTSGVPKTDVQRRLRWLEQRAPSLNVNRPEPFLPQPYTQLARVLREQGDEQAARDVEESRLRIESWRKFKHEPSMFGALLAWEAFRVFFRYGLSPRRALTTFLVCVVLGGLGVDVANRCGLLVQNTTTSASQLQHSNDGPVAVVPYATTSAEPELLCGSAINEFGYAADVFIPLLTLHQEERCDVRSDSEEHPSPVKAFRATNSMRAGLHALWVWPLAWQWAKMLYAVLGRIVSSLMLLTVSGALRRWESR